MLRWDVKSLLPDLDSYRGRYTYFALLAGVALMTFSYLGWSLVKTTTQTQIENITSRTLAAGLLVDAQTQLNLLESHLQRILIEPKQKRLDDTGYMLEQLRHVLYDLAASIRRLGAGRTEFTEGLLEDQRLLDREVQHLIEVRRDVQSWFPAMKLMLEEMYPHNQQMLSELQILLQEVEVGLPLDEQVEVVIQIAALQRLWLGMTGELRLMVANRFGIFSTSLEPESQRHHVNVFDYAKRFIERLHVLESHFSSEGMQFVSSESLLKMEIHYRSWMSNFAQVRAFMDKPTWRMDLHVMGETVAPILERMRRRFSSIDLDLDTQSKDDIAQLRETAKQLSVAIFGAVMLGLLMLFIAYLFINRNLLRPIAQTAMALKQEASGMLDLTSQPMGNLRETQDLVDAFSEMRRQVRSRQRHLDHMAHHDALTQLPNRILFRDRLEHALAIALRGDGLVGLMFLDLDRFKQVNDSLGHLVGDELLKLIAERLTALMRSSDTVARLSGDEFAILIEGVTSREAMVPLAEKILHAVEQPAVVAGHELRVSTSIGIAMAPQDDVSVEYLLRDADAAMYEAKRHGRSAYCFFSGEMTSRATEGLQRENEIRHAVEAGEFTFHFQPIVDAQTGALFCFEALLRWQHPERGILSPDTFLSVLDETGQITTLFEPMLRHAIAFQREQSRLRQERVAISINLSARPLNDPAFCRGLLQSLVSGEISPGSLILEITEDILTQELAEADIFLQQAKSLGARIALDDFGTGQASLSHLRQFPFDLLKIDRDFIRNVNADANDASLVQAMVQLAHAFRIKVVAEGVESEDQLAFLQQQDCDYIQGYLVGFPQHAEAPVEPAQHISLFQASQPLDTIGKVP
ncbi:MAG: EAL domain-containing protein [Candidatus Thiodiazotropha sp. (ex Dulcina madagascariensis)]|nr:EAL domain-containing protein [Candidatus Thiodiazotropha sp. (ex Dulcina madagascariensis)]